MTAFRVGDLVLTPDDRVATVVYLGSPDGAVIVEMSGQWQRFGPGAVRLIPVDADGATS